MSSYADLMMEHTRLQQQFAQTQARLEKADRQISQLLDSLATLAAHIPPAPIVLPRRCPSCGSEIPVPPGVLKDIKV